MLWNVDEGLSAVDKYLYVSDNHIKVRTPHTQRQLQRQLQRDRERRETGTERQRDGAEIHRELQRDRHRERAGER